MTSKLEAKQTAQKWDAVVKEKTTDITRSIIELGDALIYIYNDDLWAPLNYRGWEDYCERAADISPATADMYMSIAERLGPFWADIPAHQKVGVTKCRIILRVCTTKTNTTKWLRIAANCTCNELRVKVRNEIHLLRRKGYQMAELTERTQHVGLVFKPAEKEEFQSVLESVKEELGLKSNGAAALELARAWYSSRRKAA